MTATTEIYTYLHTLALHVARPISRDRLVECDAGNPHPRWERREQARGHRGGQQHERPAIARRPDQPPERLRQSRAHQPVLIRRPAIGQPPRLAQRSEEHTSELQSLMRISYAVF